MDSLSSQVAKTDYLSLLTIQLQNQDPIDPVDQESLVDNLTQFSILDGVENLNTSFEQILELQQISQGVDLVGKNVQYTDPSTGAINSGNVTQIFNTTDGILISVNNQTVGLDSIVSVAAN